jgi:adenylate cyclase class 2
MHKKLKRHTVSSNKGVKAPEPELEVKFFDINLPDIRRKLTQVGATVKIPQRLMRRVVFGGEANSAMSCTYARVRDEGNNHITMSAKYSAAGGEIASQMETEVVVSDFEACVSALVAFGLTITNHQENKRETWQMSDGTLVELETWPDLPNYMEIEGKSVDAIKKTADTLGLNWERHTTDSTDRLYASHTGLSAVELKSKLSDLRFDSLSS